jgi:hypothetical protein
MTILRWQGQFKHLEYPWHEKILMFDYYACPRRSSRCIRRNDQPQ